MATRAYWSGQIRLSLVSIPVDIVPATKPAAKIAFHQVHKPSGSRVRYQKVVPGVGPVENDDIVKGFEVDKGKYVLLSDKEIEDVKLEAKKTIDLVQFVDEDSAAGPEILDNMTIVHDLVTHIDWWTIFLERAFNDLDSHLHAGAKAAGLGKDDANHT